MGANLDPIPDFISGEKVFERCSRPSFEETEDGYQFFEQLAKKFFEQFRYEYDVLGPKPLPEDLSDGHVYKYIKNAADKGFKDLNSNLYNISDDDYIFRETRHVHFTRFHAFGGEVTPYPLGKSMAHHHLTLEDYVLTLKYPLFKFAFTYEILPYLFPTDHNFFLESANNCFFDDERYDIKPEYPIYHQKHKEVYTEEYFINKLSLSALLLNLDPNIKLHFIEDQNNNERTECIRTINFSLKILYSSILILSGFIDIFGETKNPEEMKNNLDRGWSYPNGEKIKGINIYHLNILSFLYLTFHPTATLLGYGLYRNKYGVNVDNAPRTAFYVKREGEAVALKEHLAQIIKIQIAKLNSELIYIEEKGIETDYKEHILSIKNLIKGLLILASYYGVGYKTAGEKGVNVHINDPKDFKPKKCSKLINDINFVVKHNTESPFWRLFYDYCSGWWDEKEIESIISGKGKYWGQNKNNPRIRLINIFYGYAFEFLKIRLNYIKDNQDESKLQEINHLKTILGKYQKI